MSMLSCWNPFLTAQSLAPYCDFDELFRNFGLRPFMPERGNGGGRRILIN